MKRNWLNLAAVATTAVLLAVCSDNSIAPKSRATPSSKPTFAATEPFNDIGNCLAADFAINNKSPDLSTNGCTANDVAIAKDSLIAYSLDGNSYTPYTGAPISCDENTPIFIQVAATLKQTDNSARTDIGIWIANDGGNARTGVCGHYNLVAPDSGTTVGGVSNVDGDFCGDLTSAAAAPVVPLGIINSVCHTDVASDSLHVGSCVSWSQTDVACPANGLQAPSAYRLGTVPGTSSKCNCSGFNVPITVRKLAKLEVVKACDPTTDAGTFDLLIDGSTSVKGVTVGDNKACGTGTGAQTLGAGTNTSPGAVHTFGEGDFTTANYTSSYACVNRLSTGPQHMFGANGDAAATGTSLGPNQITLQPNEDVVCTYTNVRKPQISVQKALVPTTDPGTFDFTIGALSQFTNSGAGYGNGGSTGFQNVSVGSVTISEAAHSGTTASNYTSQLACVNASNASVTVGSNTGTSGSITVAAGDQITCTFTNTRKPQIKVVKALVPTTDAGKFDFAIGASSFTNSGAGYGDGGTTGFQTVSAGAVTVSEAAHTGTSATDYTSQLACVNASNASVTVGTNTGTSGSITVVGGDQITCTFTNSRKPQVKLVKSLNPTTDGGKFDLTIAGTAFNNGGTGYGNGGTTDFQNVAVGSVSFSEAAHTGTSLSDYSTALECRNAASSVVASNPNGTNTAGSVTVAAGDRITCTFTNTNGPQVKVVKALVPTTDGGKFDFAIGASSFTNSGAGYGDGGTTGFQPVSIGTVSLSEAGHGTTALTDYTSQLACVNSANASVTVNPNTNTAGSISVAAGDRITCTFTNSRKPQVKLVKSLNPTTDGGKFDLTIAGTAFNNGGTGYGNGGTTDFQNVAVGSVSFSEAAHTGTSLSDYSTALECRNAASSVVASNPNGTNTAGSVTVAAGDRITCTFTNSRAPQVKVVKSLNPTTDLGTFDLSIGASSFTNGGAGYGNGGTTGFQNVAAGSVSVGEAAHSGTLASDYTSGLACVNASNTSVTVSSNTGTSGSISVVAGDQITCTFTNTRKPKVKLVKSLSPTTDPGKFDFTLAGTAFTNSGAGYGDGGTTGFQIEAIGSVSFSEAAHSGTTLTDYTAALACVNASSQTVTSNPNATNTAGSVTVAAGDQITCTFTNTRNTGKLELKKALNPTTSPGKFNLAIKAGSSSGSTVASATDVGNGGTTGAGGTTLNTGTYNLSEAVGTNTSAVDYFMGTTAVCVNRSDNSSVTVTSNNVSLLKNADVVCTFSNTEKSTIIIEKEVVGGSPDNFYFTRTKPGGTDLGDNPSPTLTDPGPTSADFGSSSSGKKLDAGTYQVCEINLQAGWSDPTAAGYSFTADGLGDFCTSVVLGAGQTKTVHFVNRIPPPGGGTRTIGYWKNWSSCAQSSGGQYTKAIKNGTPEGTLDFYLNGAGVTSIYPIGSITSLTCTQAVNLLSKNNINGTKESGDPIYNMVAQLLGAKINVASGTTTCAALNTALPQAQTLLVAIGFDGIKGYTSKNALTAAQVTLANSLAATFDSYNQGTLGGGCPSHI